MFIVSITYVHTRRVENLRTNHPWTVSLSFVIHSTYTILTNRLKPFVTVVIDVINIPKQFTSSRYSFLSILNFPARQTKTFGRTTNAVDQVERGREMNRQIRCLADLNWLAMTCFIRNSKSQCSSWNTTFSNGHNQRYSPRKKEVGDEVGTKWRTTWGTMWETKWGTKWGMKWETKWGTKWVTPGTQLCKTSIDTTLMDYNYHTNILGNAVPLHLHYTPGTRSQPKDRAFKSQHCRNLFWVLQKMSTFHEVVFFYNAWIDSRHIVVRVLVCQSRHRGFKS